MLFDLHMPDDGNGAGRKEWLALFLGRHEDPVAFSESPEVASFGSFAPLVGMTSLCPVSDVVKQLRIDPFVDLRGDTVPVKQGPSPHDRIESRDEFFLGSRLAGSDNVLDLGQKGLCILAHRGCQELLPTSILSEMLAQEINPFRDVGDGGLLFREFQTPFF